MFEEIAIFIEKVQRSLCIFRQKKQETNCWGIKHLLVFNIPVYTFLLSAKLMRFQKNRSAAEFAAFLQFFD